MSIIPPNSKDQRPKTNLLFISYYFPPTKSIACVRAYNVCYEFLKKFKVWVFTTSNTDKFLQDEYPSLDIEEKVLLKTMDLRTAIPKKAVRSKMNKKGISLSFKLLWSFPLNLFIGIGGMPYIVNGVTRGRELAKKEGITHLYSSFYPYSDHFIAYFIKKKFPDLIWIADFRDLHMDGKHILWPKLQEKWNRRILKKANVVTTVSNGLKQELDKLHPNVQVVRNGIGALNRQIKSELASNLSEKFIFNYTGNLIPNERVPDRLMEALGNFVQSNPSIINKVILRYAGFHNEEWREKTKHFQIENISETDSMVSLKEANQRQLDASVNLLLTSSTKENKGILTGKFYEYLNAGKPIIVLIKGEKDEEFEHIIKELQAGIVVYHDDKDVIKKIELYINELFEQWQSGSLKNFEYTEKIREYTLEYQMEKLSTFIS